MKDDFELFGGPFDGDWVTTINTDLIIGIQLEPPPNGEAPEGPVRFAEYQMVQGRYRFNGIVAGDE